MKKETTCLNYLSVVCILACFSFFLSSCNPGGTSGNSNNTSSTTDTSNTSTVTVEGRTSNMHFNSNLDVNVPDHSYDPPGANGCNPLTIYTINSKLTGKMNFFLLNSSNADNSEDVIIKVERMDYSFDLSPCDITDCRKVAPSGPPLKHVNVTFDATWSGNFMGFSADRCCVTKSKISISNFTIVGNTTIDNWILDSVKRNMLSEFDSDIAHEICKRMNNGQSLPDGDSGRCNRWMEMQ